MNLYLALTYAGQMFKKRAEKFPAKEITIGEEELSYAQISAELYKVADWTYPHFETRDLQKVVRCQNCKYFQRLKKRGTKIIKYICTQDNVERSKDFFCANGIEKDKEVVL